MNKRIMATTVFLVFAGWIVSPFALATGAYITLENHTTCPVIASVADSSGDFIWPWKAGPGENVKKTLTHAAPDIFLKIIYIDVYLLPSTDPLDPPASSIQWLSKWIGSNLSISPDDYYGSFGYYNFWIVVKMEGSPAVPKIEVWHGHKDKDHEAKVADFDHPEGYSSCNAK